LMIGSSLQAMDVGVWGLDELNSKLLDAIYDGKTQEIAQLIANGANVNAQGFLGATPLILAAKYGHRKICELLVDHEAKFDLADSMGKTALMWAADQGDDEMCKLFINAMALPTKAQTATLVALSGSQSKKGMPKDVRLKISKEEVDRIKREKKPDAQREIMKIENQQIRDKWLDYLNRL
jgi:ankyrin repeat protein